MSLLEGTITAAELMDLIEARLGERPSPQMLSKAPTQRAQTPNSRVRLTAGLPAPIEGGGDRRGPRRWDRAQVDYWLERHPRVIREQARAALAAAWPREGSRAGCVREARNVGMSWAEIAAVITEVDGVPMSRQAVHLRFAHLI